MELREKIKGQIEEIMKSLYGMEELIKIFCLSKAADLTILMLGEHAIAKSSLARVWSITMGMDFRIVTSSEVDEALIAYIDPAIFREKNIVQMRRGELMTKDHILVDEFFLWSNKFRAKLHQLLEERTYAGLDVLTKTYTFATNPLTEHYSGQIEERNLACYSEDTEILTLEGWKKYQEMGEKERIFTRNQRTGEIEIEEIEKKFIYPYTGKMYHLETQQIDTLVTPNHRIFAGRVRDHTLHWDLIQAREIFGKKHKLTKTGIWVGRDDPEISEDFLRIFGYYLAEGSPKLDEKTGHYGLAWKIVNPILIDKAVTSLRNLGYNPSVDRRGCVVVWNKELYEKFRKLGKADEKFVFKELKELSPHKLEILLVSYLEGDGWKEGNQWLAKTVSRRLRDDLQEIALKCGKALNYSLVEKVGSSHYMPSENRFITARNDVWLLHLITKRVNPTILGKKNKSRRAKETWIDYSGIVWCVKTKNGVLYVRRNGKAHWSGNTEDRIDLLLPMYQPKVVPTQLMIKKFGIKGRKEIELSKVIDWQDYADARQEIMKIEIPPDILVWLTLFAESMSACKYSDSKFDISRARMHTLCAECNQKEHLCAKVALSKPRFLRATILLAKALAWFDEREEISEEDIFMAIKYTLPHRIIFLKEERTIFEAERALPDLVQQFIDDFNNWESRRIFQRLEDIITKAKDPKEPVFDNAASNELLNETSEHLAINNYITEAIERVKEAVKKRYREILMQSSGNLEDMKTTLGKSGLDLYEKGQILEEIIGQNPNLTFYYPIDRREEKALGNLINVLRKIHKEQGDLTIKTKARLMKQFKKEISFVSDLLIIKEERGRIKITTSTPELKKKMENYLSQGIKEEEQE